MANAAIGAQVQFGNHQGFFHADIFEIGNVNVVRASGPVSGDNIIRHRMHEVTHTMQDLPEKCFWRPDLGVFVCPKKQVKEVKS